tara:strand:+ start:67 stop:438 length:372 start_codon:yes stop_codon:yes gene_type:complete
MPSPYKRGKSGYSEKDEAEAKRYGEMTRIQYQDLANRKAAGEKGIILPNEPDPALGFRRRAEANYKANMATTEGRDVNRRNMEFNQGEVNRVLETNSREQYESEKEAGDPNALRMSFAEWKKL